MRDSESSFTDLLRRSQGGETAALDAFLPSVYQELRRLAERHLADRRDAHTLQPTALVHEVYLRMIDQKVATLEDRAHFRGLCARVMRQILVDHARRHSAEKRGGGAVRVDTCVDRADGRVEQEPVDVLAFHEALERLALLDPRKARVVELRTFAGVTMNEIATDLGVSKRTVEGDWFFARAWLRSELD